MILNHKLKEGNEKQTNRSKNTALMLKSLEISVKYDNNWSHPISSQGKHPFIYVKRGMKTTNKKGKKQARDLNLF